jgi:hypothetical protein
MTMLRVLEATIQSRYRGMRGLVSFHYGGKKLRDELEQIGNIIHPNSEDPLIIRMDKTKTVISGAFGQGGIARSSNGPAFAGGGFAGGGEFHANGTAIAATGIGGNVEAESGAPGIGMGGVVWDPDGRLVSAKGGDGVGGRAILTGQSNENAT